MDLKVEFSIFGSHAYVARAQTALRELRASYIRMTAPTRNDCGGKMCLWWSDSDTGDKVKVLMV